MIESVTGITTGFVRSMVKAVRIHETGGPEVLKWEDVAVGDPGPDQICIAQTAVGLNFIDTRIRAGVFPVGELPLILGGEGAGIIESVGPGVDGLAPGQRVAYASGYTGACCEKRLLSARDAVPLPKTIDDKTAAAVMVKGLTAQFLIRRLFVAGADDTILVHAAAGGVGLILCQWAKYLGCTVIGTVGSEDKAQLARTHGCDYTIDYRREDVAQQVRDITAGQGVSVVYDSVGKNTFQSSLDSLRLRGMMVSFGNASGPVPPLDSSVLRDKGSLVFTRPTLGHFIATRDELMTMAQELFRVVSSGHVRIEINQTYPLEDAALAHADLEARRTTGSTVLLT